MGRYIEECNMYQRMKNRIEVSAEKLKLSKILGKLWIYLIVNFITKLLLVAGKYAILVDYNRLYKMTYFVATKERKMVEELIRLFRNCHMQVHLSGNTSPW